MILFYIDFLRDKYFLVYVNRELFVFVPTFKMFYMWSISQNDKLKWDILKLGDQK